MVLLVIDMQKGLVDEDLWDYEGFKERVFRLVEEARRSGTEVVFVQHDAGEGSGFSVGDEAFELVDELLPRPGEKVFVKTINSCFGNAELKAYLKSLPDKRLMIVGLQTNYCVDATVKSAFERGFDVFIPEGTNSTFDNDFMSAETTVRYYNEDVWEELVDAVSLEEAVALLRRIP